MSFEKTERVNQLLDLYENMLTLKQKDIMTMYYRYDYSLSEIASELNVSRTAVFDLIKRTTNLLEKYEAKIKMFNLKEKLQKEILTIQDENIKQKLLLLLQEGE